MLRFSLAAIAFALAACGSTKNASGGFSATHEITAETALYRTGPQQGSPPEAILAGGTRVRLIDAGGSYTRVETEHHGSGWVVNDALRALPVDAR